ncbi:hypothetical protein Rsub_07395 [Raphidocelis subcapitata]|uniref:Protein kinase domain-containing protein n=1 Tax=Raphidocelis subcapitata TaxID=307507 RepID=A0A2V0P510_9CHLO|nr:hypothetical protein Rsub_07395 [Raphidocelis subcapitata]|eukprot:GBF94659.1 hypothetical protein Rsub_07395 [Raphidocelis subcapitata]
MGAAHSSQSRQLKAQSSAGRASTRWTAQAATAAATSPGGCGGGGGGGVPGAGPQPPLDGGAAVDCIAHVRDGAACDGGPAPGAGSSPGLDSLLHRVHEFQSSLAAVSEAPGLGLSEAAELLLRELGAATVGLYAFCGPDTQQGGEEHRSECGETTAVLLAACGAGADVLERFPVVASADWSCLRMRASGADALPGCAPAGDGASDGGSGAAGDSGPLAGLPLDWRLLHSEAGLCGFLSVPIGPASRPWGALVLASRERDGASAPAWRTYPRMAAVALVHQVRHWQTAAVCTMLREAAATDDSIALIGALLRGAQGFMQRALNATVGVRLAVLDALSTRALVFEPSVQECADGLVATELFPLFNTLLAGALATNKARFVRDCALHLQSSAAPARDIFTQPAALVSSLVVVPFVRGGGPPLAALYLSLEAPSDFSEMQSPLLGLINSVRPLLHARLDGALGGVWAEAGRMRWRSSEPPPPPLPGDSSDARTAQLAPVGDDDSRSDKSICGSSDDDGPILLGCGGGGEPSGIAAAANGGAAAAHCGGWPLSAMSNGSNGSGRAGGVASCRMKRMCTQPMLKAVEQMIFDSKRRLPSSASGSELSAALAALGALGPSDGGPASGSIGDARSAALAAAACGELLLSEMIGAGGYGAVWRGSWKKVTAAIKVMYRRGCEAEAVMDAVEMAVLSAVSHPHVVQVYACLTEMVEAGGLAGSGSFADVRPAAPAPARAGGSNSQTASGSVHGIGPRYRRLLPFEDPEETATCNIIVMEYCDLGTLRVVTQRGLFHRRLSPGPHAAVGVDLAALLEVSLQVAEAVAHLHSLRLVHCDIKLDNVLLKTEVSQPRGYIAKLGDFGLARVLGPSGTVLNAACAGTVNHLAPELFVAGSAVTTAADAYAFGVLMWEIYTGGGHAHAGLGKEAIVEGVARGALRPRFPAGTPCAYAELAAACWSAEPAARPHFPAIIAALHGMLNAVEARRGGTSITSAAHWA